jgi:hypothetical protein
VGSRPNVSGTLAPIDPLAADYITRPVKDRQGREDRPEIRDLIEPQPHSAS